MIKEGKIYQQNPLDLSIRPSNLSPFVKEGDLSFVKQTLVAIQNTEYRTIRLSPVRKACDSL